MNNLLREMQYPEKKDESPCLETVVKNGDRAWANLQCDHQFHLGEFNGNAAFAGGGFMPSQANTQAPDSSSSFKNRDVRTLLSLTLKQLSSVSTNGESNFSIDGVDINTVTIVGRVTRMENRITQVDLVVEDGTGCVECVRWCHERQETEEVEARMTDINSRYHKSILISCSKALLYIP